MSILGVRGGKDGQKTGDAVPIDQWSTQSLSEKLSLQVKGH